jgi:hypothetical protein
MTATTSSIRFAVSDSEVAKALPHRRRRVTPEVGRALEKLNHAIEYLTDEHVYSRCSKADSNDHACTVQLLMGLRNRVFLEAPEVYSLRERCKSFLTHLLA